MVAARGQPEAEFVVETQVNFYLSTNTSSYLHLPLDQRRWKPGGNRQRTARGRMRGGNLLSEVRSRLEIGLREIAKE